MSVKLMERNDGKVLEVEVSGKLHREDYQQFVPEFERLVQKQGKLRLLFVMNDFHGWDLGALWQDIKFDLKHFADIERLAMVGETKWQEGMSKFCSPFTRAEIRYFAHGQIDEARRWIEE